MSSSFCPDSSCSTLSHLVTTKSASSLFQHRFMNSIQELLIAPLSYMELIVGFLTGTVLRGLVIGNLVMVIGRMLVHAHPKIRSIYFYFIAMTALLFSAVGMIAGLLGRPGIISLSSPRLSSHR